MPEISKLNREKGSSGTEEPGIGAKGESKHAIESSPTRPETKPQTVEQAAEQVRAPGEVQPAAHEQQPDHAREKGFPDFPDFPDFFADSAGKASDEVAASGPEHAARSEDAEPSEPDGSNRSDDDFFTGWDGLDEIHELSADQELLDEAEGESQSYEKNISGRTLSEIALAAAVEPRTHSHSGADLSIKHDELAEAVQSALNSLYGQQSSPSPLPSRTPQSRAPAHDLDTRGASWGAADTLSPQDVILNYFSYDSAARPATGSGDLNGTVRASSGDPGAFPRRHDHHAGYESEWPSSRERDADFERAHSYPVPAGFVPSPKAAAASERESSRLLGAAAIGLVGGIAIAASLAVFVISSYNPAARIAPGAGNRVPDASESGYGRWPSGREEPSKSATAMTPPEQTAAISAADIAATPGQPSPLAIEAKQGGSSEQTLISITGVPEGVRLNAGVDAGGGNWLLPPRRLNGLSISVPAGTSESFLLGVQLLDSNVRTPLSEKKQFAVHINAAKAEPTASIAAPQRASPEAAAPPEAPKPAKPIAPSFSTQTVAAPAPQPEPQTKKQDQSVAVQQSAPSRQAAIPAPATPPAQPNRAAKAEVEDLIHEGNKRMREGDILEARQFYQKAVVLGDPDAALAMGRSYDPVYFARIDKKNAQPDAAKAFEWYRKAMDGGAAQTAKVRIENLKHFLNE